MEVKMFKRTEFESTKKIYINSGYTNINANPRFLVDEGINYPDDKKSFLYKEKLKFCKTEKFFVLLTFNKKIIYNEKFPIVALDLDCVDFRFLFYGTPNLVFENEKEIFSKITIYKSKSKTGKIERIQSENRLICSKMFSPFAKFSVFQNFVVRVNGHNAIIKKSFGDFRKTGKFVVAVTEETEDQLKEISFSDENIVKLDFKKIAFGPSKGDIFQ
ncbi:hypothetical protein MHBO_001329 [Bonamia ostreae]|uniref:Selenocysteine-specific elongation factor C-terminal RIFT domain-containing protein n=1 Tax=Bonamia ostreae TaxID=126728 RepID=A0ABV2AIK9_9EUKA